VNHFLYDVVKRSPLVQYRAKLFLHGFWDDFDRRNAIDLSARQNQLQAHRSRWSRLEWATRTTAKVSGKGFRVTGGVLHFMEDDPILHFVRLPSVSREIAQEEWVLPNLGFNIECYSIDPAVDLLVAVENQVADREKWVTLTLDRHCPSREHSLIGLDFTSSAHLRGSIIHSHLSPSFYTRPTCRAPAPSSSLARKFTFPSCPTSLLSGTGKRVNWYLYVRFQFQVSFILTREATQKYGEYHEQQFVALDEEWLLLTRRDFGAVGSAPQRTTIELCNTTLGDDIWANRCTFAFPESGCIYLPVSFPNSFCPCPSPTFCKRPEDRILLILHQSDLTGTTGIVVFVSTLLHFFKPRRFVAWDEWKKYTWIADPRESAMLRSSRTFFSSSGFLHHRPHPDDDQILRVTMTSLSPSIEENPSPYIGSTRNDWGEHIPVPVAARKRVFDIHIGTDRKRSWYTEVMMTEDNIIITTVRLSPDYSVQILTLER